MIRCNTLTAEQSRAEQSRAEQSRAEQSASLPLRAVQNNANNARWLDKEMTLSRHNYA